MSGPDPAASALLSLLTQTGRGPKRGGLFALWLTLRVAQDVLLDPPLQERAHRRRVQALERRLTSLTMPPPLRRALAAAVNQLREVQPEAVAQVLSQLVAPARETGGSEAAEALALAVKQARHAIMIHASTHPTSHSKLRISAGDAGRPHR